MTQRKTLKMSLMKTCMLMRMMRMKKMMTMMKVRTRNGGDGGGCVVFVVVAEAL